MYLYIYTHKFHAVLSIRNFLQAIKESIASVVIAFVQLLLHSFYHFVLFGKRIEKRTEYDPCKYIGQMKRNGLE